MSKLDPSAITPELIDKIKRAHPNKKLFKWAQLGIIYTPISRDLHDRILKLSTEVISKTGNLPYKEIEELVVTECVIFPKLTEEDRKELPIGTYTSLNKIIHEKSGLLSVDVLGRPLERDTFSEPITNFEYWPAPTEEEIEKIKKVHPYQLYKIYIGEYIWVARQLSRMDVELTEEKGDPILERAKKFTIFPEKLDWDSIPAGVVDQLHEEVRNLSGYMESNITIEEL